MGGSIEGGSRGTHDLIYPYMDPSGMPNSSIARTRFNERLGKIRVNTNRNFRV